MPAVMSLHALALTALVAVAQVSQPAPDFMGRWQLESAPLADDVPSSVRLSGSTASPRLEFERRYRLSTDTAICSDDLADVMATCELRRQGSTLVLLWRGNGGLGAAPPVPDREIALSLDASGLLHVDLTERLRRAVVSERHLIYRRASDAPARRGENLVANPAATEGTAAWRVSGDAAVEPCDGNPCFVVRNRGVFQQVVTLPPGSNGLFVLMRARGASERPSAEFTGSPYLYGLAVNVDGQKIVGYLQSPRMMGSADRTGDWTTMWGVSRVPAGTRTVVVQLSQAQRQGTPSTGSAARFDDVACVVFETEAEALHSVATWLQQPNR